MSSILCFADEGERALIDTFFPDEAKIISQLENEVLATGHDWRWHEGPPQKSKYERQIQNGQLSFMPLCVGCKGGV